MFKWGQLARHVCLEQFRAREQRLGTVWRHAVALSVRSFAGGRPPRPIEQLTLTGTVTARFPSISAASKATGSSVGNIRRVLQKKILSIGDFFYRDVGSNAMPSPDAGTKGKEKAVEQICLETGNVLNTFSSIAEAARSLTALGNRVSRGNIGSVLSGKRISAGGFFWRYVGSKAKPRARLNIARQVEMIDRHTRKVVKTFASATAAAEYLGVPSPGYIYEALKGKINVAYEYRWRYKDSALELPKAMKERTSESFCYLLASMNPEYPDEAYIGYTVRPLYRLDQHNGLKKRGAKRTATARPWEMILVVAGFPTHQAALRFEARWQRFVDTRLVEICIDGLTAQKRLIRHQGIESHLAIFKEFLITFPDLYEQSGLKICFADTKYRDIFEAIRVEDLPSQTLPSSIEYEASPVSSFVEQQQQQQEKLDEIA